ncbi:MAG TPA: hypothetical protein VGF92_01550 [Stellaceae bacterium]|jgi:hypothetical protein
MLSDDLEGLAADVIGVLGKTLVAGAIVRKLRRYAGDARKLEQCGRVTLFDEEVDRTNVESIDHARRQKQLANLATHAADKTEEENESGH